MAMGDPRPIGIFDSGVGGLTVLSAIRKRLPHEPTIYLADLFHFPYGPRYQDEVRGFAFEIIRYLEARDVKLVVIACNTATAAALNQAREHFEIPIVGVISPGAQAAVDATQNHRVGVISTTRACAPTRPSRAMRCWSPRCRSTFTTSAPTSSARRSTPWRCASGSSKKHRGPESLRAHRIRSRVDRGGAAEDDCPRPRGGVGADGGSLRGWRQACAPRPRLAYGAHGRLRSRALDT